MPNSSGSTVKTVFCFGNARVEIVEGDIADPPVAIDAIVSTDDNYLTMASGVSARLREKAASPYYARSAQAQRPVQAGTVVTTKAYGLSAIPDVRCVLHGTAINYDAGGPSLRELVYQTTANCLEMAESLRLKRILFPVFAAGSGGLSMAECAHQMCQAVKAFLAQERRVTKVYIILYKPSPEKGTGEEDKALEYQAKNLSFIQEANLVLDVPYDPESGVCPSRDFYGREQALEQLEAIISGCRDDEQGKWHAAILGGPRIGKQALLNQLFRRAKSTGGTGRHVARLTFGHVHEKTPKSFVYHKLLLALAEFEEDESLVKEIKAASSNADLDCLGFWSLLDEHMGHHQEIVFLVDHLPRLLKVSGANDDPQGAAAFWSDLDELQTRVRFVYTARDEEYETLRRERLEPFTVTFKDRIEIVSLRCLTEEERKTWVNALFQEYLDCPAGAPWSVHQFFAEEAGLHPYLIGLVGYSLVTGLKGDALRTQKPVREYDDRDLQSYQEATRSEIQEPRRVFFQELLGDPSLTPTERHDLEKLAQAVAYERAHRQLLPGLDRQEPEAIEELYKLRQATNPRLSLHPEILEKLERRGYLVHAGNPNKAQFMAEAFDLWLQEYFGLRERQSDRPDDVFVAFLNPEPNVVTTLFGERGGHLVSAKKRLSPGIREQFMEGYRRCINDLLHGPQQPTPGPFADLENVANFVLTYFTTNAIREYLSDVPEDATISLAVDEALKDIPWELMLERAYVGDTPYPFAVGRRIVSQELPRNIRPPVGATGKVRALLIGDPTDDLDSARREVRELADQLRRDGRFIVRDEDLLIGSEQCQLCLLDTLSSGQYGLIHYSGHSKSEGSQSSWILKDGLLTVDLLTAALQNAPPTMVVSSSCQSAAGAAAQAAQYENQTFDLPSAFLQAGVVVYVGTLWSVVSRAAERFVEGFYGGFLTGKSLGVCLQQGKRAIRGRSVRTDRLAFIMYGDPHARPGDLFPAMLPQKKE